ncbi:hypothetical protein EJB05_48041, partial [Eragrostis curvula]
MAHPVAIIFGILGNIISFMVFLAPVTTFWEVCRRRTTGGFSSVPYLVALFSSALWIFYAHVKTNSHLLLSINIVGCVAETIYTALFIAYAPRKEKLRTLGAVLLEATAMGVVIAATLKGFAGRDHRVKFLGGVCLAFSLAVFAAPLTVIVKVVRTRSVEFLPFGLSFCLLLSAVAWFFYGFFTNDSYVMYPNVAGFLFSCVQIGLYFWYRNAGNDDDGSAPPPPPPLPNGGAATSTAAQGENIELAPV